MLVIQVAHDTLRSSQAVGEPGAIMWLGVVAFWTVWAGLTDSVGTTRPTVVRRLRWMLVDFGTMAASLLRASIGTQRPIRATASNGSRRLVPELSRSGSLSARRCGAPDMSRARPCGPEVDRAGRDRRSIDRVKATVLVEVSRGPAGRVARVRRRRCDRQATNTRPSCAVSRPRPP